MPAPLRKFLGRLSESFWLQATFERVRGLGALGHLGAALDGAVPSVPSPSAPQPSPVKA